jgi:Na+/proline symporter
MWDSFMKVLGLFGGPTGGFFLLGIFTRRAHGTGAVLGALGGVALVALAQNYTGTSFVLYTAIGVVGCVILGYLFSLLLPNPRKPVDGLTIYTKNKN